MHKTVEKMKTVRNQNLELKNLEYLINKLWLEAVNPSEEATSGNSARRSWIHFGVVRRLALSGADGESGAVGRMTEGLVGESALKTLWFETSSIRLKCFRKSAPKMGMATGAS